MHRLFVLVLGGLLVLYRLFQKKKIRIYCDNHIYEGGESPYKYNGAFGSYLEIWIL